MDAALQGDRQLTDACLLAPAHRRKGRQTEKILQTAFAFWPSKVLLSAVESARDFLDTLVALGFLQRDGEWYSNTPETDRFLDRRKPSYLGGMIEMANHRLYPFRRPAHATTAPTPHSFSSL